MHKFILGVGAVALAAWGLGAAPVTRESDADPPALEIVSRFAVSEDWPRKIVDLRWAAGDSIYLADWHAGIAEVKLEEGLPRLRSIPSPTSEVRMHLIRHIAISDKWIVAASLGRLAWRSRDDGPWQLKDGGPGFIHELDVRGDELVILGSPDAANYERSKGGMVWRADLSKGLDSWEVLHESEEVAKNFELMHVEHALGSIRYLRRGEIVVAPTFVPGVLLFAASGSLKTRWSPADLWRSESADKRAASAEGEWWTGGRLSPDDWPRFLGAHRTIEEVLPLSEGPAIVVREPRGGQVRYRLGVLGAEPRWYTIPFRDVSTVAQVRGDVDSRGRIVLMGVVRSASDTARVASSEVLIARLPQ